MRLTPGCRGGRRRCGRRDGTPRCRDGPPGRHGTPRRGGPAGPRGAAELAGVACRRGDLGEVARHGKIQVGAQSLMMIGGVRREIPRQSRLRRRRHLRGRREFGSDTSHGVDPVFGEIRERHRRDLTPSLGEDHRPQPQREDPSGAGMDVGGDRRPGRPAQDETPRRPILIDHPAHRIFRQASRQIRRRVWTRRRPTARGGAPTLVTSWSPTSRRAGRAACCRHAPPLVDSGRTQRREHSQDGHSTASDLRSTPPPQRRRSDRSDAVVALGEVAVLPAVMARRRMSSSPCTGGRR